MLIGVAATCGLSSMSAFTKERLSAANPTR
jgi:hypothetical protein